MQTRYYLLLLLFQAVSTLSSSAYDFEVDGIFYTKTGTNSVEVTKNGLIWEKSPYQGDVIIPPSVEVDGHVYEVYAIGDRAFYAAKVSSVTLPETIRKIKQSAFGGSYLTAISLPEGLETIEDNAFSGSNLTAIELPEGLQKIGMEAFSGTPITSVVIPSSVISIGYAPFGSCGISLEEYGYCHGLSSISVAEGNMVYDSRNNCNAIIETATNKLIQASLLTVIPEDITTIQSGAYETMSDLTTLYLPASVQVCEKSCMYLKNLKDLYIAATTPPEATTPFGLGPVREYEATVLHVPMGCKEVYQSATCWKEFQQIEEFDPLTYGNPTAIEPSAFAEQERDGDSFDLQGRRLYHSAFNTQKGVYIRNGKKFVKY